MKTRSYMESANAAIRCLGQVKVQKESLVWEKLQEFFKYTECVKREKQEREYSRDSTVVSPYLYEGNAPVNPLDAHNQEQLRGALLRKHTQLLQIVHTECNQLYELERQFENFVGKIRALQDELGKNQIVELETAGNIRFEECSPEGTWFARCSELVHSRASALPVKLTRVAKIHNKALATAFEDKLEQVTNNGYKRKFDYLFYGTSTKCPGELRNAALRGFRTPRQYAELGLPGCICLSHSLDTAETERVEVCRELYGSQSPVHWPAGQALLCKVYLGRGKGDLRMPFFSRRMSLSAIWDLCAIPKPSTCWAVYRTLESDQGNRVWFLFEESLVLPEYLIQFEYIPNVSAQRQVGVLEEFSPSLDYIDHFSSIPLERSSTVSTCPYVQAFPSIPIRSVLGQIDSETLRGVAGCRTDGAVQYLSIMNSSVTGLCPIRVLSNLKVLCLSSNELKNVGDIFSLRSLEELDLSFNSVKHLNGVEAASSLQVLELHHNKISCVSNISKLLKLPLTSLSLFSNPIAQHSRYKALISALPALRQLDWQQNTQFYTPANFEISVELLYAQNCPLSLDSLNLSGQGIVRLRGISILKNLRVANFSRNFIEAIEDLQHCWALQDLELEDNALTSASGLATLRSLTKLNLANNNIKELTGFSALEALSQLCLEDNKLRCIQELAACSQLSALYVSGNSLRSLDCLKELENLIILDIQRTPVMSARIAVISLFPRLKVLNGVPVATSELNSIQEQYECRLNNELVRSRLGLSHGSEAKDLELSGLKLRSFESILSYSEFPILLWLDLSRNSLSSFTVARSLQRLQKLDLSYNQVESLQEPLALPALESLDLSHNRIRKLNSAVQLPKLRVLKLQFNMLRSLSNFTGFHNIETLLCNNNRLTDIAELDKLSHLQRLSELGLSNNPLAQKHLYRLSVFRRLPMLLFLDTKQLEQGKTHEPKSSPHREPVKLARVTFNVPVSTRPSAYRKQQI